MATGYGRNMTPKASHGPGGAAGDTSLSDAVGELHRQHPYKYDELVKEVPKSNSNLHRRPFSPGPGY